MQHGNRPLIVAGAALAVLVAVAAIVVVAGPRTDELDPDSPEGVVQAYVQAIVDGDEELARSYVDTPEDCTDRDPPPFDDSFRMTLSSVDVDAGEADVAVVITRSSGEPPFDRYESTTEAEFSLQRRGSEWLVTDVPWEFRACEEEEQT